MRNILQVSEIAPKRRLFHSGPNLYEKLFYPADAIFMLEAMRYLGYDSEAQEGLETIWDMQSDSGAFIGSGGEHSYKDTAAAVYALGRHADLTQNFDFYNEMYPDAYKAMTYLRQLRLDEYNKGKSENGKLFLLPPGIVETGTDARRPEVTNFLWTCMALMQVMAVANKFYLVNRVDMRDFQREIFLAFQNMSTNEMTKHPAGFSYLSMLLSDDPQMKLKDKTKRPAPQYAQFALTNAIFPGLLFRTDHPLVTSHLQLMDTIIKEDVPYGTGELGIDAVQNYHAPALAQVYIWANQPQTANKIFRGFLNHASPEFSWRTERSLHSAKTMEYFGDMPSAVAAAQCIIYLRNSLIMEDLEKIRLMDGLVEADFLAKQPIMIQNSPTRWGRVSLAIEPVDEKTWTVTYKRERYDTSHNPKLTAIEFPRRLTQKLQFDKATPGTANINGGRVSMDPLETSWVATYREFGR